MKISDKIRDVRQMFDKEVDNLTTLIELEDIKNKYLSRKGIISKLFSDLSALNSSSRPAAGNELNNLKKEVSEDIQLRINNNNKTQVIDFVEGNILVKPIDYYYTNVISRSSKVMSECRQISKNFLFTGIEKAS